MPLELEERKKERFRSFCIGLVENSKQRYCVFVLNVLLSVKFQELRNYWCNVFTQAKRGRL